MQQLVLASASSRRQEILSSLGITFKVLPQDIDERPGTNENPIDYVVRMALEKAQAAHGIVSSSDDSLVLGADTVISFKDQIIGKPLDEKEAYTILKSFSGQSHKVLSAVALVSNTNMKHVLSVSKVEFRELSDEEIRAYCKTGEPFDKAGAYGIQGLAGMFIRKIKGSYTGIVGLPVFETLELLASFDITPLSVLEQHQL